MYRGCLEAGLDRDTKVGRTDEKQGNDGKLCLVGSWNFVNDITNGELGGCFDVEREHIFSVDDNRS